MKRHPDLETLSFEHHDALVIALRLKKGLSLKADLKTMGEYALSVYHNHLKHHFEQEEATLIKPLQDIEEAQNAVQQMINEHQRFAELASALRDAKSNFAELIREFAELLDNHVRFEERTLFPLAERLIPEKTLKEIGEYLHREHRPINKEWPVQFWQT